MYNFAVEEKDNFGKVGLRWEFLYIAQVSLELTMQSSVGLNSLVSAFQMMELWAHVTTSAKKAFFDHLNILIT